MAPIKIYYDKEKKILTVWFDEPEKEYVCDEINEQIILIKDKENQIIGIEKLFYDLAKRKVDFSVEAMVI